MVFEVCSLYGEGAVHYWLPPLVRVLTPLTAPLGLLASLQSMASLSEAASA